MRLDLLKPIIRANMRTANRRLQQYAKSGVDNPHLNSILEKIKGSPFYDAEKNKLKMSGLSKRDLETLAEVQKEIKSVDTVKKYTKKVEEIYDNNKVFLLMLVVYSDIELYYNLNHLLLFLYVYKYLIIKLNSYC